MTETITATTDVVNRLQPHPAAAIFPMMDAEAFRRLKEDIQEHGQRECIVCYEGKILDGRNRYQACLELGIEPDYSVIETDDFDPVAYVISLNLCRRHLDESQRAMAAARAKGLYSAAARERQRSGGRAAGRGRPRSDQVPENLPEAIGDVRDVVGAAFNVSGKSVDAAAAVLEHGSAELIAAVDAGTVAVSRAAKVAKASPPEIQMDELAPQSTTRREAAKFDESKAGDQLCDWLKAKLTQWPEDRRHVACHWITEVLRMFRYTRKDSAILDQMKELWKAAGQVDRAQFQEWTLDEMK